MKNKVGYKKRHFRLHKLILLLAIAFVMYLSIGCMPWNVEYAKDGEYQETEYTRYNGTPIMVESKNDQVYYSFLDLAGNLVDNYSTNYGCELVIDEKLNKDELIIEYSGTSKYLESWKNGEFVSRELTSEDKSFVNWADYGVKIFLNTETYKVLHQIGGYKIDF